MPRAAKPTRLPGGGGISMTTEPDFFVKQGDFQALAAGRPMLYYRDPSKALVDWEAGWRDYFVTTFPGSVEAIDAAVGGTDETADTVPEPAEAEAGEDGAGAAGD
jgi:hypothetical protein